MPITITRRPRWHMPAIVIYKRPTTAWPGLPTAIPMWLRAHLLKRYGSEFPTERAAKLRALHYHIPYRGRYWSNW